MRAKCLALCLVMSFACLCLHAQEPTSISQIGQFTAPNLGFQSFFGTAAISPSTIVVSAPNDDLVYGALYVYDKPSSGWTTMSPTAMVYAQACVLGSPVAISNDGTVIAASLAGCYGGLGTSGSAIGVFTKPAGGWQTFAAPTATVGDNYGLYCGYDFAMSSDGKTIACTDRHGWIHKNFLYLFDKPVAGWASTGVASSSIQLSYTPGTVAINSKTVAVSNSNGSLVVYQRTSNGIQQLATLTASDGAVLCCDIVMDGDTIVVNGYLNNLWSGTSYLFSKPSTGWTTATETAQLTVPTISTYAYFGQTLALSGKAVLVGGENTQAAYIFLKPAGGWQTSSSPNITILSNDPNQVSFGDAVSMLGNTIVIGDALEGASNNQNGAAYIYQLQ